MPFGPPQLPPDPPPLVEPVQVDTATSGGLEFSWDAPAACGSAASLAEQVERYLANSGTHALKIDATAAPRDVGWHLSLSMARPGQTTVRELDAPSCELLTKAAALVIAVHVDVVGTSQGVRELVQAPEDFLAVDEVPEPEPSGEGVAPPLETTDVPTTVAVRTRRDETERRARRRPPARRPTRAGILRLITHGGVGERPGFFGGIGLAGGYQQRTFRIEVQTDYAVPRVERQGEVAGSFQAVHATARGCWVSSFERWEFPLCGGFRAGGLRAIATRGAEDPQAAWSSWLGVTANAATIWSPIPDFGIYGGLGVLAAIRRPSFRVGLEGDPLYTSAPVGVQINLGFELKLF